MTEEYIPLEEFDQNTNYSSRVIHENIHGSKAAYDLKIFPKDLYFGNIVVDTNSPIQQITLLNLGYKLIHIESITDALDSFTISHNLPKKLFTDDYLTINIKFTPKTLETIQQNLQVNVKEIDTSLIVTLNGKGT